MPRKARIVAEGYPHHITQRGNNRQNVFFKNEDRNKYIEFLKLESEKYGLAIHGYCIMTNHVHLIAIPETTDSLAKAVGRTNFRYARYINKYHEKSGHLWQSRFYACALDFNHYWKAMKYVERNPVRAQIVKQAWEYKWSSAGVHVGGRDIFDIVDMSFWNEQKITPDQWIERLVVADDPEMANTLVEKTTAGLPLGEDGFVGKLETVYRLSLRPSRGGRPKKGK